jgi:3-methyladenine DNA glycosylase AlkD
MQDGENLSQYEHEVREALRPFEEPERVNEARSDKNSQLEFLAVRVPAIEKVVKRGFSFYQRAASDILTIWDGIWFSSPYFEVMTTAAMYYGQQRGKIDPASWPTLSRWSSRVDNWAHADQLAGIYSFLLAQGSSGVYGQLEEWNASDNQWLKRISLVSLIHYTGKNAVFLPPEQVLPLVMNCIGDERYYVQKAVGWVLREMGQAHPQAIDAFLQTHLTHLLPIAFTRAIEHRTSEERALLRASRKQAKGYKLARGE